MRMNTVRGLAGIAVLAGGLLGGRPAWAQVPTGAAGIPAGAIRLSYVDDTAEGRKSLAGDGFAVQFNRPENGKFLVAVQIFASRYGQPQPPAEYFHVYVLGPDGKLIRDIPCPYALIARTAMRWYTIPIPSVEVPPVFRVGLNFNAEQFKGVYLGTDRDVERSHSSTGLPDAGYRPVAENSDWMVRAYLAGPGVKGKGVRIYGRR